MEMMQRITPTTNIGNSNSLTSSIKGMTYILNSIQMTPTKMVIPNNIFALFASNSPLFLLLSFSRIVYRSLN